MIKIKNFLNEKQEIQVNLNNKINYGEIFSPYKLISNMLNLFPEEIFLDPNKKWLDPGAGIGYFSIFLYYKLMETLKPIFFDSDKRSHHIIKNMIFMIEINSNNCVRLKKIFGEDSNVFNEDFLLFKSKNNHFDVIIGNPPFNSKGMKKVPTNTILKKKQDGCTIWGDFLKKGISLLKNNGFLCFITPSIWMKPDKSRIYFYINQFKIHKLHALNNTQTNQLFSGQAQTPCAYYLLEKKQTDNSIQLYDYDKKNYYYYSLFVNNPIPVFGVSIINKFLKKVNHNTLKVFKTNLPKKDCILYDIKSKDLFENIHTCKLNHLKPELVIKYSSKPCAFHNKKKLIMAHGMYGFPFIDKEGKYGISNRDKYVIVRENNNELKKLHNFFSTKTALYLFESTRYRMKYLEKYIFDIIPDITQLTDFPEVINDETIAEYFDLDELDKANIKKLHKKNYEFFQL